MTNIIFKQKNDEYKTIAATNGISLMLSAVKNEIDGIKAICGGNCSCATCHIVIEPDYRNIVAPLKPSEQMLLSRQRNKEPGSRLACQITVNERLNGMRVVVK
ncbi:MAG: 2Fe-2S iron-sulfur cluster binding domain-containing protein [Colwellia sp.]|nr:2Fe-2S iron-sulfur cluster binding domain-containing protein [Colwellia sp.]